MLKGLLNLMWYSIGIVLYSSIYGMVNHRVSKQVGFFVCAKELAKYTYRRPYVKTAEQKAEMSIALGKKLFHF